MPFIFKGSRPKPPKGTAVEFDMDENANGTGHHSEWYAKMVEKKGNTIKVEIKPACNCIIGEWEFSILTSSKIQAEDDPLLFKYTSGSDITILLNPWCERK